MRRLLAGIALTCLALIHSTAPVSARAQPVTSARQEAADAWKLMQPPFLWPNNWLTGIAGAAPDSVWISGVQRQYCVPGPVPYSCVAHSPGNPVVRRWNGTRWLSYPLGGLAEGTGPIHKIAASPGEIWIGKHDGYLARFTGSSFTRIPTPTGRAASTLSATPAGVWVKEGAGTAPHRWTGSAWAQTPLPEGFVAVNDIKARTADQAWLLGRRDGQRHLLRWNGAQWQDAGRLPSILEYDSLPDMAVAGPDEIWVIRDTSPGRDDPSRIFRYAGGSWTEVSPALGAELHQLIVDSAGRVLTAGMVSGQRVLLRYDGTAWRPMTIPEEIRFGVILTVPGSDALWSDRKSVV